MKIHEYNEMMSYLTRPARVGFSNGGDTSPVKTEVYKYKAGNRFKTYYTKTPPQNQWVMRTDAEIQKILDNPKYEGWTKKDFRGETKKNKIKILAKTETERPGLKFPHEGKTADPTKKNKSTTKKN